MSRGVRLLLSATLGALVGLGVYVVLRGRSEPIPTAQEAMAEYERRRALEYSTVEIAEWFGKTGLGEETEREVPRYLRLELGEFIDDPKGLKASDLKYVGAYSEGESTVHYWRIPYGAEEVYAYVELRANGGSLLGWGNRSPPKLGANAP